MEENKIIIGFVGEIASGKGLATKYLLKNYGASQYKFSDILKDILDRVHLDKVRENFASLSLGLREYYGEDILAYALASDIKNDDNKIIVIDGIRREADLKYLKEMKEFILVYIDAYIETRYKRLISRNEKQDDTTKTFEEFKNDNNLESELEIEKLKNKANIIIDNNGSLEELKKQIDKLTKDI